MKKYWKNAKKLEKSGKFVSPKKWEPWNAYKNTEIHQLLGP